MGKASRARHSDERKKRKKAAKEVKKTLYKSYSEQGKAKKKSGGAVKSVMGRKHPTTPCGNVGCKKCYPHENRYRIAKAKTAVLV